MDNVKILSANVFIYGEIGITLNDGVIIESTV